MKQLKLKALILNSKELLSREQMKHVLGAANNQVFGTWCGDTCDNACELSCSCRKDIDGAFRCLPRE